MTTTQDLITRLHPVNSTVGSLPTDFTPGDVLFDSVLPGTGLALVAMVRPSAFAVEIDLDVVLHDGSTDDVTITWHSTLPLGRIPGVTAGYRSGFWANLNHNGSLRHIDGCAELVDALDAVVI